MEINAPESWINGMKVTVSVLKELTVWRRTLQIGSGTRAFVPVRAREMNSEVPFHLISEGCLGNTSCSVLGIMQSPGLIPGLIHVKCNLSLWPKSPFTIKGEGWWETLWEPKFSAEGSWRNGFQSEVRNPDQRLVSSSWARDLLWKRGRANSPGKWVLSVGRVLVGSMLVDPSLLLYTWVLEPRPLES